MGDLELFLHDDSVTLPILIKAALAHVQFETIPLLYLSLYFKTHRHPYYDHLQSVRETGNWEAWITFFLEGVIETAGQAVDTARTVLNQFAVDQRTIATSGRSTGAIVTVFSYLQRHHNQHQVINRTIVAHYLKSAYVLIRSKNGSRNHRKGPP